MTIVWTFDQAGAVSTAVDADLFWLIRNTGGLLTDQKVQASTLKAYILGAGGGAVTRRNQESFADSWRVDVGGAQVVTHTTSMRYCFYASQSPGALNDVLSFDIAVVGGVTYDFKFLGYRNTNTAIASVYVGGVLVGSIDMYGAAAFNTVWTIAGVSGLAAGRAKVELKMLGRNASSTGYISNLTKFWAVPSAF